MHSLTTNLILKGNGHEFIATFNKVRIDHMVI